MKAAVLVFGQIRQLPQAIKSWKFLHEIDCDVYVSTWDKSIQINKKLGLLINENITEDYIKKYLPNSICAILNENDYNFPSDIFFNNSKQIFHWKNCLKLIENSNQNYDIIIMTRPDNFIEYNFSSSNFFKFNNIDTIYGQFRIEISDTKGNYFLPDLFFCGKTETISKFIRTLNSDMKNPIHTELAKEILSMNMYVERIYSFDVNVVRPNCVNIENLNIHIVHQKYKEWNNNNNSKVLK